MVPRSVDLGDGLRLCTLSRGAVTEFDLPQGLGDFYLIAIPLHGTISLRHGRDELLAHRHLATVLSPTAALRTVSSADCALLTVHIDHAVLDRQFTALAGATLTRRIRFQVRMDLTRVAARRWLRLLLLVLQLVRHHHGLATEPWFIAGVRSWVVGGLLFAQPHDHDHLLRADCSPESPLPRVGDEESIGVLLRRHRRELGLSQAGLARRLAEVSGTGTVDQRRVSDWERESVQVGPFWLPHLACALDIPLERLASTAAVTRYQSRRSTV